MAKIVEKLEPGGSGDSDLRRRHDRSHRVGIFLEADEIFAAIEKSFLDDRPSPRPHLVHALGIGDGRDSGLSRFAHQGMVRRVIGGHWSWSPRMQKLAADNLDRGLFLSGRRDLQPDARDRRRAARASSRELGLGTFADPRRDAGRCNRLRATLWLT